MTQKTRGSGLKRRHTLTAAALGLGAAALCTGCANAQKQVPAGKSRTFVLVHGSWHGGWCWRRVSDRLERLGHKVYTPTLTGLGERSHLLDEKVNLTRHITDIVNVIKWDRLSNVVLVGHSYAGYPVSGALEHIGDAVGSIFSLDAFLPENGDSIIERGNPRVAESIRAAAAKKQLSLPPLPASFFQVNEADRAWVDSLCTPQPLGTYTEKLVLTGACERIAKTTYIRAKGYAQPTFDAAEEKLKKDPSWRVLPVQSGHGVKVDVPDRLVQMLLEAACCVAVGGSRRSTPQLHTLLRGRRTARSLPLAPPPQ